MNQRRPAAEAVIAVAAAINQNHIMVRKELGHAAELIADDAAIYGREGTA